MIFNEEHSKDEVCKLITNHCGNKFRCHSRNNKIYVNKKLISIPTAFPLSHIGSTMIHAETNGAYKNDGKLFFQIGLTSIAKFVITGGTVSLVLIMIIAFNYQMLPFIIVFTAILILWLSMFYRIGKRNFLKDWKNYIQPLSKMKYDH